MFNIPCDNRCCDTTRRQDNNHDIDNDCCHEVDEEGEDNRHDW